MMRVASVVDGVEHSSSTLPLSLFFFFLPPPPPFFGLPSSPVPSEWVKYQVSQRDEIGTFVLLIQQPSVLAYLCCVYK